MCSTRLLYVISVYAMENLTSVDHTLLPVPCSPVPCSIFHLPSSIFHLPSSLFYLLSSIFHLPSFSFCVFVPFPTFLQLFPNFSPATSMCGALKQTGRLPMCPFASLASHAKMTSIHVVAMTHKGLACAQHVRWRRIVIPQRGLRVVA